MIFLAQAERGVEFHQEGREKTGAKRGRFERERGEGGGRVAQ